MKPEVKYRLIEKLIQTEDEEILSRIKGILDSKDIFAASDEDLVNRAKASLKSVETGQTRNIKDFKNDFEAWKAEKSIR
ncbi:hypothetical protein [Pleomorphovibrio marinus]|uniref:hypothetical protein n=1 Tax=Pleomorphovibrio marinus TaxID=2164132 RepID=UPI000E0C3034|nr:hypothetical protein [Pleomorphovibrio marinus]